MGARLGTLPKACGFLAQKGPLLESLPGQGYELGLQSHWDGPRHSLNLEHLLQDAHSRGVQSQPNRDHRNTPGFQTMKVIKCQHQERPGAIPSSLPSLQKFAKEPQVVVPHYWPAWACRRLMTGPSLPEGLSGSLFEPGQ